jgi:hypothetical protein
MLPVIVDGIVMTTAEELQLVMLAETLATVTVPMLPPKFTPFSVTDAPTIPEVVERLTMCGFVDPTGPGPGNGKPTCENEDTDAARKPSSSASDRQAALPVPSR